MSEFLRDYLTVAIFGALKKYGLVLLEAEVTVEVNPESITKADLIRLRKNPR